MDWMPWKELFAERRLRPVPEVTRDLDALPAELVPALVASLARFQRGETGEGRIANEVHKIGWSEIDPVYVDALRLFVAEEGRHARILGQAVKALGGEPAPEAWSGKLFELGRRALDPRFELVALLAAEVAAIGAYQALVDRLPACGLREALAEIVADEEVHRRFHAALFAQALRTRRERLVFTAALSSLLAAAAAVLLADHAPLWRALGVSRRDLARSIAENAEEALRLCREAPPAPARAVMAA